MIPAERRQKMLEYITNNGSASITQLSDFFDVSEMTVHRDLRFLETTGYVQKKYGGVISSPYEVETDFNRRLKTYPERKEKIGKVAASMINDGDSILLDASTTILAIIPFLNNSQNLMIFTTSIAALTKLSNLPNFEIYSCGGLLYKGTDCLTGPSTISYINDIHVDKCFISASGICSPEGITDPISIIAELKRNMAKSSKEVIVCMDKSKFGRLSHFNILPLEEIDLIITDAEIDSPCVKDLKAQGLEFFHIEN
jgi:DeoR family fructose operon transcriptional repressor